MNKNLPSSQTDYRLVQVGDVAPNSIASESAATTMVDSGSNTPLAHPRPQSFAGFARWEIKNATPPSGRQRAPLPNIPTSRSMPNQLDQAAEQPPRLLAASQRHSLVMLEANVSSENRGRAHARVRPTSSPMNRLTLP